MSDFEYAHYRSTDNTLLEQELESYSETSGTTGIQVATVFAEHFGFELIDITAEPWTDEEWNSAYAAQEAKGNFTAERRAELFDN